MKSLKIRMIPSGTNMQLDNTICIPLKVKYKNVSVAKFTYEYLYMVVLRPNGSF